MYFAIVMKRIIVSSIIALVVLILAATGFYYSQKYAVIHSNPIDAIPSDAAFFLEMNNGAAGMQQLKNTDFFKSLLSDSAFKEMQNSFHWLDSTVKTESLAEQMWKSEKLFISAHPTKANDFDFLYCCNLPRGKSAGDVISIIEDLAENNFTEEIREYEDVKIYELKKENNSYFTYAMSKGVFLFSRTSFLVEDGIRQLKNGISFNKSKTFTKLGKAFGKNETILLFVNHNGLHDLLTGFMSSDRPGLRNVLSNISRWSRFSIQLQKNSFLLNGLSSSTDTTDLFYSIKNQTASISRAATIAPSRTAAFIDFSVTNLDQCLNRQRANGIFFIAKSSADQIIDSISKKNKIDLKKLMTSWASQEMAMVITEPGSPNLENNTYALIKAKNVADATNALEKIQSASGKIGPNEKYRGHAINNFNVSAAVPLFYGNIFIDIQKSYYSPINNFIVFANSPSILKSMIDDIEDKKTLDKEEDFQRHTVNSALNGQINFYFNLQRGGNVLRSVANDELSSKLINDGILRRTIQSTAFAFSTSNDLTTSIGRVDFSGERKKEIHLLWSAQLDTNAITPPFVVKKGNEKLIAIQDAHNDLNLYNESGELIWKKFIGEKILSSIVSMDQYNNGEVQMVFNTPTKLYVIDSKGDSVGAFPIRLPAKASNGCLVKDFDGRNKYEIYVACENGMIYAYESTGKPIDEWIFKQTLTGIQNDFQSFKIGSNSYLVAQSNQGISIIDRRGKVNKIKTDFTTKKVCIVTSDSSKAVSIYMLDTDGILHEADAARFSILENSTPIDSVNDIASLGNQLMILRENQLFSLSGNTETATFTFDAKGKYKLINGINDELKVAVSDVNANRFYLLEGSGQIAEGFPIYGNSRFNYYMGNDISENSYIILGNNESIIYIYTE